MAFKMKGSPHKMGGIQGTSEHASALKQKKSNISINGNIMTNTETGDTYNIKTGETIKNKKPNALDAAGMIPVVGSTPDKK